MKIYCIQGLEDSLLSVFFKGIDSVQPQSNSAGNV